MYGVGEIKKGVKGEGAEGKDFLRENGLASKRTSRINNHFVVKTCPYETKIVRIFINKDRS